MYFSIHWAKGDSGPWNISCVFLSYRYRCINFMASNQPVSRAAPCLPDLSIQQWHKQLCLWLAGQSQLFSACGLACRRNAIQLLYVASLCVSVHYDSTWSSAAQSSQLFLLKTNFFVCWTVIVPASYTIGTRSFRVINRPGAWCWPPTPTYRRGSIKIWYLWDRASSFN